MSKQINYKGALSEGYVADDFSGTEWPFVKGEPITVPDAIADRICETNPAFEPVTTTEPQPSTQS